MQIGDFFETLRYDVPRATALVDVRDTRAKDELDGLESRKARFSSQRVMAVMKEH